MKSIFVALVITLLPVVTLAQSPNDVVAEAAQLLDQKLSENKEKLAADREALYALIDEILLPRFDRRYAAQLVLGPHWRTASAEQREQFIDAFYSHLLRRYADGVLEFDLGMIQILAFRGNTADPRTMVRTTVTLHDGTKVPVDYGLVKREQRWLMFDVTIEGISYVRNFRAEINSEIQSSSLDAVIRRLQGEAQKKDSSE